MEYVTIVGIVGAGIILLGFLLNQLGKVTAETRLYDVLNAVGALFLIVYAILLVSYPFLVLNTVWFVVSMWGLLKKKKI